MLVMNKLLQLWIFICIYRTLCCN